MNQFALILLVVIILFSFGVWSIQEGFACPCAKMTQEKDE
jgi:hypothetical protein